MLAEIDAKVDVNKLEDTLMREGVAKFADPQNRSSSCCAKSAAGRSAEPLIPCVPWRVASQARF